MAGRSIPARTSASPPDSAKIANTIAASANRGIFTPLFHFDHKLVDWDLTSLHSPVATGSESFDMANRRNSGPIRP
ncbi:MAG TPA: hypothetical protein VLC94_06990 [Candidatus Acidoferrum sp.]|nr:hypothetical protein [Candidatus Acidoferrum sp.]